MSFQIAVTKIDGEKAVELLKLTVDDLDLVQVVRALTYSKRGRKAGKAGAKESPALKL